MTWAMFWRGGEKFADRFYGVAITLWVLKTGGYLQLGWTPIVVCWIAAFVGDIAFGIFAVLAEDDNDHATVVPNTKRW